MKTLKIRRMGNSNVVPAPHELAQRADGAGSSVMTEELESELRVVPADRSRALIHEAARRIKAEDQEALRLLAEHERAQDSTLPIGARSTAPHV